jgi:hypothetical protein
MLLDKLKIAIAALLLGIFVRSGVRAQSPPASAEGQGPRAKPSEGKRVVPESVAAGVFFEAGQSPADQALAERAAAIKPVAEELRWQQIPWLTDLAEGQRLAQAERRPIFLWVTGDDPLERC